MFPIGEFARLGQVSPHILHHYDQLGLLVPWEIGAENSIADPVPGHILMGVAARGGSPCSQLRKIDSSPIPFTICFQKSIDILPIGAYTNHIKII